MLNQTPYPMPIPFCGFLHVLELSVDLLVEEDFLVADELGLQSLLD